MITLYISKACHENTYDAVSLLCALIISVYTTIHQRQMCDCVCIYFKSEAAPCSLCEHLIWWHWSWNRVAWMPWAACFCWSLSAGSTLITKLKMTNIISTLPFDRATHRGLQWRGKGQGGWIGGIYPSFRTCMCILNISNVVWYVQ